MELKQLKSKPFSRICYKSLSKKFSQQTFDHIYFTQRTVSITTILKIRIHHLYFDIVEDAGPPHSLIFCNFNFTEIHWIQLTHWCLGALMLWPKYITSSNSKINAFKKLFWSLANSWIWFGQVITLKILFGDLIKFNCLEK